MAIKVRVLVCSIFLFSAIETELTVAQPRTCFQLKHSCLDALDRGERCDTLPVPPASLIPPVPFGEFRLTELRSGVWVYDDGAYLTLILNRGRHLVMVDFPDSENTFKPDGSRTRLTDAAEQILDGKIPARIDLVYSHEHFDHISSVGLVQKYFQRTYPTASLKIWGTEQTRKLIVQSVSKRALVPDKIVRKSERRIVLGRGLELRMKIIGGHAQEDLLLYVPKFRKEEAVAMYVDTIFPGWTPPFDLGLSEDIGKYIAAHQMLIRLRINVLVPGHLKVANKADVITSLDFVNDLVDAAKEALMQIPSRPISLQGIQAVSNPAVPEFGNIWYAFISQTRELQIDICEKIMVRKWACRLAAVDITTRNNCFAALTYLIEEY